MGVTLDTSGNCGDNMYDPEKFLDAADTCGAPVNLGLLVGHTWLRNLHGRRDKYKAVSAEDIEKMTADAAYYLNKGFLGVSFGLKYVPGTRWEEVTSLSRLCQKGNKLVAAHVRTDVDGVFEAAEELALKSPLVMLGSDGVRHEGKGHPRASGAFPRFISDYIRTDKISLVEGIRKMSTMAADRLNLPHKGNLLLGSDGDIVIFDMDRVKDCATYEKGQIPPVGFDYVLIGGEIALKDDKIVNSRLVRSVRR